MDFRIEKVKYKVPSTWADVKFKDFALSREKGISLSKKLSYHTTIPETEISKLPYTELLKLIWEVKFQDDLPEMYEPVELDLNVGNEAYIKLEQSRKAFEQGNQWLAAIAITKIYTEKKDEKGKVTKIDIGELSVVKAFGYAVFFLNRLKLSYQGTNG